MADDWNSRAADNRYCMHTSWNPSVDMCVDLTSPGVVVLDTTVVVGLRTFEAQAPVVRVLPGVSGTLFVRNPAGFYDLLIENLLGTWHLSLWVSGGPCLDFFHQGPQCSRCHACLPCTSG